jgi:hypothetical protein
MTEFTRPATWDDLIGLARALEKSRARYALIGGYAIAAHGYQRFSEDIDILVDPSPACRAHRACRRAESIGALARRSASDQGRPARKG